MFCKGARGIAVLKKEGAVMGIESEPRCCGLFCVGDGRHRATAQSPPLPPGYYARLCDRRGQGFGAGIASRKIDNDCACFVRPQSICLPLPYESSFCPFHSLAPALLLDS